MKLGVATSLFTLAVIHQAQAAEQNHRMLEQINFNGDGCIDYDNTDAGWFSIPICDDCQVNDVNMGMDFTYAGTTYNEVDINTNGHLHFTGSGSYSFDGNFVGDSDVNIAPYWADIHTGYGGIVRYKSFGNKFAVVWEEVALIGYPSPRNTFQVVLTADGGAGDKICFCYGQMEWSGYGEAGISAGPGFGFLLAGFTTTDTTWNGVGTMGNGVGHVAGHSYCFDPSIVNAPVPAYSEITTTDVGIIPPPTIDFNGDGCVDYYNTDQGWVTLPLCDDCIQYNIPLGFSFTHGGSTFTEVDISPNGHLHFTGYGSCCGFTGDFIGDPDINVAPFWGDVNNAVTGQIRYKSFGNKFVVTWQEVAHFGGVSSVTNTFQVVLTADGIAGDKICFCYGQMEWARDSEAGMSMGTGSGILLAGFTTTDTTWNGVGTMGNGVGSVAGHSYCWDRNYRLSSTAPGVGGDPHFKTWKNEHFEYHGQCDLVLTKDQNFADGLGLDIHIRTKLVRNWSYIKNAVIRIGNDILEVEGSGKDLDKEVHFWKNYEYQAELTEFAGFPVTIKADGTKLHKNRFEIDLSSKYPGQKIAIQTFKEFVKVEFVNPTAAVYGNTVGMLGDYHTGKTLARDGATVLDDFTDLGREWQVLPSDKKLFRESSAPQFPELCIEPEDPRGDRARRLAESSITYEQAEAACAGLTDALDRKDCVYDIISTQDLDMAGAY